MVCSLLLLCGNPLYEYTTVYPFVVDGHLGRCQVWAFISSAAMHIIAGLWDVRVCVTFSPKWLYHHQWYRITILLVPMIVLYIMQL